MVLIGLHVAAFAETGSLPRTSPIPHGKIYQYTYRTDSITFYNLTDVQAMGGGSMRSFGKSLTSHAYNITVLDKKELGADLAVGTPLRDVFFVYDGNNKSFKSVTLPQTLAANDPARFQAAYPLGEFMEGKEQPYFAGQPVYGFAIAAIGGILFTDSLHEADNETAPLNAPIINCQASLLRNEYQKNCVRYFPIQNNENNDVIQPKKGQTAPVTLAYGITDDNEGVILTQFEYLVSDSTWRIQILYYTVSGKTEFIIGHFGINTAESTPVADKSFFVIPAVVKNGSTTRDFIAFGKGKDKIGINIGHLPCWSVLTTIDSVNKKGIPANGPHRAKIGRRISVVPPVDSAAFTLEGLRAYPNRLEGWGVLDPRKSSKASYENIRSILILSSDQTPEQNAANPPVFSHKASRYKPGDKVSSSNNNRDAYTVLFDTMPTHFDKLDSVLLTKGRLKQNANYYLYVYMGDTNAYTEMSYFYHPHPTAIFGPHKTDYVGAVTNFEVSEIIKDSVVLNIETESDDAYSVIVGSLNVNPLSYNDMVGIYNNRDVAVSAFLKPGIKKATLYLPKGEGGYLHCYAAKIIDKDTFYTDNPMTKTVYRPCDTLPLLFRFSPIDISKTAWPDDVVPVLPPGWQHGPYVGSTPTVKAYFSAQKDFYNTTHLHITAPEDGYRASLLTPVFISNQNKVQATFAVVYQQNNLDYTPVQGQDSIYIEYRINSTGQWQTALALGDFPIPTGDGRRLITTAFDCAIGDTIGIRYSVRLSRADVQHGVTSLFVERGRACQAPVALTAIDHRATQQSIHLTWTNPNTEDYSVAYRVFHQEAKTELFYSWESTRARTNNTVLTDLKPFTTYRVYVQAICSTDTSMFSRYTLATTAYGMPYIDGLNKVYADPNNAQSKLLETPQDRGFTTHTGKIGTPLTANGNKNATWSSDNSFFAFSKKPERAMGIGEHCENGVLVSPGIYTEKSSTLDLTLSSFKRDSIGSVNGIKYMSYGASPSSPDCKLRVAISNTGTFNDSDVVMTLTGEELNLIDSTFSLKINKTGRLQVGFFFENPVIRQDDKFYLEAKHLAFTEEEEEEEYTLILNTLPEEGGTTTGAGKYTHNTNVTITATPNEGYFFVKWMDGDTEISRSNTHTFPMPDENKTYTAVFKVNEEIEYEVALTTSPADGGVTMGGGFFKVNTPVVIAARANAGYEFVAWVNANNETDTVNRHASYGFTMPPYAVHYKAVFRHVSANEDQLRACFNLSVENGVLTIRNLSGVTVKNVDVYGLNGAWLHHFTPNSREDLNLPLNASHALLFVRVNTEKGVVVYKVYWH